MSNVGSHRDSGWDTVVWDMMPYNLVDRFLLDVGTYPPKYNASCQKTNLDTAMRTIYPILHLISVGAF